MPVVFVYLDIVIVRTVQLPDFCTEPDDHFSIVNKGIQSRQEITWNPTSSPNTQMDRSEQTCSLRYYFQGFTFTTFSSNALPVVVSYSRRMYRPGEIPE